MVRGEGDVFLMSASSSGGTWSRVRVGVGVGVIGEG